MRAVGQRRVALGARARRSNAPPSSLHSKVAFGSLDVNVKPALVAVVSSAGWPVRVVLGSACTTTCRFSDAVSGTDESLSAASKFIP